MSHVSKKLLTRKTFLRISENFLKMTRSNHGSDRNIFAEILTDTEKIMLAKRLAILTLLNKQVSHYEISRSLKVSPSTVDRIYKDILIGKYNFIDRILKTKLDGQGNNTFLDFLEKILSAGLPPIAGPGRWKSLYASYGKN